MKNEKFEPFCEIGDVLEFIEDVITTPPDGQQAMRISVGAQYVARSLVNAGWDLRRKEGEGPDELRILNSEMPRYVKVVAEHE